MIRPLSRPLLVGQHNLPEWSRVETAFRGIFGRRFFANGGPLVRELDVGFARAVGVEHSVSVTNDCIALMILLKALEVEGEVIVPALASPVVPQAAWWAGLTPVIADVDPESFMLSPATIRPHLSARTVAVLAVRVFGRGDGSIELEGFAKEHGLRLVFDASSAMMCSHASRPIGSFGIGEAFSLHSAELVNAAEGGSITTNDDAIAAKLRTIRNFYVPAEPVALRINGKMAEAPAALALLGIDDLPANIADNRRRYARYEQLDQVPGLKLERFDARDENNYQSVVIRIDRSTIGIGATGLVHSLAERNIFASRPFDEGLSRRQNCGIQISSSRSCPITDEIVEELVQLPSGRGIGDADIDLICDEIRSFCSSWRSASKWR